MPAHVTTIGISEGKGFRHQCALCGMNRIVLGERFKHICPVSTEPNEPCPTCPESPQVEQPLPGALALAGNLAGAMVRTAGQVIARKPVLRSPADKAAALAICHTCEFYRPSDERCAECGCLVDLKASLATEECPKKKWFRS